MIAALDTNILVRAFRDSEPDHQSIIGLIGRSIKICYDFEEVIVREYEANVGRTPGYRKWYARLQQVQGIHYCTGKFPRKHRSTLTTLGCHEPSDHAFIGTAYNSGRILVSEDSDVGKGPNGHRKPHCDALNYLTNTMSLNVYDAIEFCQLLWPSAA